MPGRVQSHGEPQLQSQVPFSHTAIAPECEHAQSEAQAGVCTWWAVLLLYQGACMPTMSQGVRALSTPARSRSSQAYCWLRRPYGAYDPSIVM